MKTKHDVVEEFRTRSICEAAMRAVARKGMRNVTMQERIARVLPVARLRTLVTLAARAPIVFIPVRRRPNADPAHRVFQSHAGRAALRLFQILKR